MSKIIGRVVPALAAAAVAATVAVSVPSAGPAVSASTHRAAAPVSRTVQDFNDGFKAAKEDDCQQGYGPACAWLHHRAPRNAWPSWVRHSTSRDGRIVTVWPAGFGTSCQMYRHGPVETT